MDNLPNDPKNPNNNPPPPFGTQFNPHTNPVDPNNPYQSSPQPPQNTNPSLSNSPNTPNLPNYNPDALKHEHYSEAAQHKPRDEHGHFIHTGHSDTITTPTPPNIPNPPQPSTPSSILPPIIEINQNTKPSDKKDPPLFGFFITNPVTYLKIFLDIFTKTP